MNGLVVEAREALEPVGPYYFINQTLGRPLVRALRARAGILLLINQRILRAYGPRFSKK